MVAVDFASDCNGFHVDLVGAIVGFVWSCGVGDGGGAGDGLGGSFALVFLAQMAFGAGEGLGKMLANEVASESWPGGVETGVDGFDPSGGDGAASGLVQVLYNVALPG